MGSSCFVDEHMKVTACYKAKAIGSFLDFSRLLQGAAAYSGLVRMFLQLFEANWSQILGATLLCFTHHWGHFLAHKSESP